MGKTKRIHIIDLQIGNGPQWTIFMQALVSRDEWPIESLKITIVGTTSKQLMEDTGDMLLSFARTMNLPFSYKVVMVLDIRDLKEVHFELDSKETMVVFSKFFLTSSITPPNRLESIFFDEGIRKILATKEEERNIRNVKIDV
ncbi:unnamed protein product [Dovyalis caffra]|uniref:Uncharacterized protein n=1 Tax=Dovyalis caffra TaxID=77055 RepID=A0AAV1R0G6_9ROSI|nr:unnamed protein product [Dovyalis caffra]